MCASERKLYFNKIATVEYNCAFLKNALLYSDVVTNIS